MQYRDYFQCRVCHELNINYNPISSYYKLGLGPRVMFIGQDPTIRNDQHRVKRALMLDNPNNQISRWLKEVFTDERYNNFEIYATNIVKCVLNKVPTDPHVGGIKYIAPCFDNCKQYLVEEIKLFKPQYVFALGEPAHRLFIGLIESRSDLQNIRMQDYFKGVFTPMSYMGVTFDYSPLLHIQGYRVAKKYGKVVERFEMEISSNL